MIVVVYTGATVGSFLYLMLTFSYLIKLLVCGSGFTPFYSDYLKIVSAINFSLFTTSTDITLAYDRVPSMKNKFGFK